MKVNDLQDQHPLKITKEELEITLVKVRKVSIGNMLVGRF